MKTQVDELINELGHISILFTNFDYLINEINASLINSDNKEIGYLISNKLSTHSRAELYKNLIETIPFTKEIIDSSKKNLNIFIKIKEERNRLIHGIWHTQEKDGFINDDYIVSDKYFKLSKGEKIILKNLINIRTNLIDIINSQIKINNELIIENEKLIKNKLKQNRKIKEVLKKQSQFEYFK
jgi:hypothetical protein